EGIEGTVGPGSRADQEAPHWRAGGAAQPPPQPPPPPSVVVVPIGCRHSPLDLPPLADPAGGGRAGAQLGRGAAGWREGKRRNTGSPVRRRRTGGAPRTTGEHERLRGGRPREAAARPERRGTSESTPPAAKKAGAQ
ncbi:unnamed protein product, partial [Prorocentrum cordatum]